MVVEVMFLDPKEIKQLTGKIRGPDQAKVLNKMRIQHILRPDGEVLISKSHMEKILDGYVPESNKERSEPNYGAL